MNKSDYKKLGLPAEQVVDVKPELLTAGLQSAAAMDDVKKGE